MTRQTNTPDAILTIEQLCEMQKKYKSHELPTVLTQKKITWHDIFLCIDSASEAMRGGGYSPYKFTSSRDGADSLSNANNMHNRLRAYLLDAIHEFLCSAMFAAMKEIFPGFQNTIVKSENFFPYRNGSRTFETSAVIYNAAEHHNKHCNVCFTFTRNAKQPNPHSSDDISYLEPICYNEMIVSTGLIDRSSIRMNRFVHPEDDLLTCTDEKLSTIIVANIKVSINNYFMRTFGQGYSECMGLGISEGSFQEEKDLREERWYLWMLEYSPETVRTMRRPQRAPVVAIPVVDAIPVVIPVVTTHSAALFTTTQPRIVQATAENNEDIPKAYSCPVTLEVMEDPVLNIKSGITYEKSAIKKWLEINATDPVTRDKTTVADLIPNRALKDAIEAWKAQQERLGMNRHS